MTIEEILLERLRALESNIEVEYQLLHEYEKHLRVSDNPRTILSDRAEMERIRVAIDANYQELASISNSFPNLKPQMRTQVDQVKNTLDGEYALWQRLGKLEQLMLAVQQAVEAQTISIVEQRTLVRLTSEALATVPEKALTDDARNAKMILASPDIGMSHKLKVSIPIFLNFLSYEGEISLDEKADVKALIGQLKAKMLSFLKKKRAG